METIFLFILQLLGFFFCIGLFILMFWVTYIWIPRKCIRIAAIIWNVKL